jgi:hypothetical protein
VSLSKCAASPFYAAAAAAAVPTSKLKGGCTCDKVNDWILFPGQIDAANNNVAANPVAFWQL